MHRTGSVFMATKPKFNQFILWSLRTFPENFMKFCPWLFERSCSQTDRHRGLIFGSFTLHIYNYTPYSFLFQATFPLWLYTWSIKEYSQSGQLQNRPIPVIIIIIIVVLANLLRHFSIVAKISIETEKKTTQEIHLCIIF